MLVKIATPKHPIQTCGEEASRILIEILSEETKGVRVYEIIIYVENKELSLCQLKFNDDDIIGPLERDLCPHIRVNGGIH